jgi:hypothetical protein
MLIDDGIALTELWFSVTRPSRPGRSDRQRDR